MSNEQLKKCGRCLNTLDESSFDPEKTYCKSCRDKRKLYKSSKAEHFKASYKQYYEARKEENKQYREDHEEQIKAYSTEKINCPLCNCMVARNGLTEHQRTRKCNKNKITTQAA